MSYEKIRKNAKGGKLIPKLEFGNKIGDRLGTSVWDGQRWVDEETILQEGRNAASGTNTAIDSMATTKVVANTSNIQLQDNGQITGGTIDQVDNNGNIVKSDTIDGKDAVTGGNNAKNAEAAKAISGKGGMNVPTGMIGDAAIALNNAIDDAAMGDKNFSASSQALDKGVDAAASMASKFGPWGLLAAGIMKTLNSASKYSGQNVQGYDVSIENSGYGTMGHMESEAGRVWDKWSGATARKLAKRNEQARMALAAMDISEDTKYEQEARANSVTNVLQQNQIALAGGIDTSLLGN